MEDYWRKAILENVPHGEEGYIQFEPEEAFKLSEMLLKRGYAVCLTGGDIGDDVRVSWIYAGDTDSLMWADYDNIVFTSVDYLEDYPEAYNTCDEGEEE
jgi:hypothetical protein